MNDLIRKYKYKAAYAIIIIIALNIATNSISASSTYVEGFFKFFIVIILMSVAIYFHSKDISGKI